MSKGDIYVVYQVTYTNQETKKEEIVYIGSGTRERSKHPLSGKSSSKELNELFFLEPNSLSVLILRENLSKEESLELEKGYIEAIPPRFNIIHNPNRKKIKKFRRFTV